MRYASLLSALAGAVVSLGTVVDEAVDVIVNPPVESQDDPEVVAALTDINSQVGTIADKLKTAVVGATVPANGSSTGSASSDTSGTSVAVPVANEAVVHAAHVS